MSNSIMLILFISLLSLPSLSTPSLTPTITIPLSHFTKHPKPLDLYSHLNHQAKSSLTRAHHLKNPNPSKPVTTTTTTNTVTTTLLSPRSYGGYSISLKFGTPPQTMSFIMDTGSEFVWFPCTHRYVCNDCSFSSSQLSANQTHIPFFIPKLSSSTKIVGCLNPKCGWIHNPNTATRCKECSSNTSNCTEICPPYTIIYGYGYTGGLALLDTLHLNYLKVSDFLVGCSLFSSHQPAGIAGFSRGDSSLPSQLGLTKFSYCGLSHQFDDTNLTTKLKLTGKGSSVEKLVGASYTPFLENPKVPAKKTYSLYYYLGLNKIYVGGKKVKVRSQYLSPPDAVTGVGGTIVDSGTTFTYMAREVFEPMAREFEKQVSEKYKRAKDVEDMTGLRPCFNVSGVKTLSFPSLEFHFKGGAKMVFLLENYFSLAWSSEVVCLTIVTDAPGSELSVTGPRIILGNYQQQNFYMEYDLKHNRFGFKQQKCN